MKFFEYLKEISKFVGPTYLNADTQQERSILYDFCYCKIDKPKNLFDGFCRGELEHKTKENDRIIYPFGFNLSQREAIAKALQNSLSVIEGPPGTGKTQTILNIIANVILMEKSVAIVSNNNSAIENIQEKLEKHTLDFLCAKLGSVENKKKFLDSQRVELPSWENKTPSKGVQIRQQELQNLVSHLDEKLAEKNRLSKLKGIFADIQIEKKYFEEYLAKDFILPNSKISNITSSVFAFRMIGFCEKKRKQHKKFQKLLTFLSFLKFWDRRSFVFYRLLKEFGDIELMIQALQWRFYELKSQEIQNEIKELELGLKKFDLELKMKEVSQISLEILKAFLWDKYSKNKRQFYTKEDFWKRPNEFLRDYPIILSTTHSIFGTLSRQVEYDYLVIDEASQVDLCTGFLAMHCAKNAVVVGDLKQLPNIVSNDIVPTLQEIYSRYRVGENYRYEKHSFISCIINVFPNITRTLLKEHYRCHPKIIGFCNQKFYGGELVILTQEKEGDSPLLLYKTVEGNHQRGYANQRQIDVIIEEIIPENKINTQNHSLGIITPYNEQVNEIRKRLNARGVKIATVDKFQGQEREVIILSTVNNKNSDFIDNSHRLNVAISRAQKQLIVVINNDESLMNDGNIGDLVRYIQYQNFEIKESKIFSVFDFLYQCYTNERISFLAKHKRVSIFDSENLTYALLEKIFKGTAFGFSMHVPLRMILKDISLLNPEEKRYVFHPNTHIDFLIFSKIDKFPKLVIEVDGVAFHKEGSRQFDRDRMKDEILRRYGISFLRLRTDGSNEEKKIRQALEIVKR